MKKIIAWVLAFILLFSFVGCDTNDTICPNCEATIDNTAKYCTNCGYELPKEESTSENALVENEPKEEPVLWDGSIADSYESGDGSPENPYEIANASQLALLAQETNAGRVYYGQYYYLSNDIILNKPEDVENYSWNINDTSNNLNFWEPIGTEQHPFEANFFGSNHTIIGLAVFSEDVEYAGLFGYARNADISYVNMDCEYILMMGCVGGIVGCIEATNNMISTIKKCSVNQNICSEDGYASGGLIGKIKAELGSVIVYGCINYGFVRGCRNIGGIVGIAETEEKYTINITNCVNYGKIYTNDPDAYIAGIAGTTINGVGISDCINLGEIENSQENVFASIVCEDKAEDVSIFSYDKHDGGYITNCYFVPEYCSVGVLAPDDVSPINVKVTTEDNARSLDWLSYNMSFYESEYEMKDGQLFILSDFMTNID